MVTITMSAIFLPIMTICAYLESAIGVFIGVFFFGFFIAPIIPLAFMFCVELTYPSPQATAASIIVCLTQIIHMSTPLGLDLILSDHTIESSLLSAGILEILVLIGLLTIILTKQELRKTNFVNS